MTILNSTYRGKFKISVVFISNELSQSRNMNLMNRHDDDGSLCNRSTEQLHKLLLKLF